MSPEKSNHRKRKTARPSRMFWKHKRLDQLTPTQWECLCDGCARCCVHKLEDIDTGEIIYTNVACRYLDIRQCRCTQYDSRTQLQPECRQLTATNASRINWMPDTCAYRLLRDGKPLPGWHPLVSGDKESVHRAGISVRGRVIQEMEADLDHLEAYAREDI